MKGYRVISADEARDFYAGTDVPGEFRRLTEALGAKQLAVTLIRVPPHCDFEQGTGHYHDEIEEIYIITRGTLTMRFGDDIVKVSAGSAVRVAPKTPRSHRNEADQPVDMWAISHKLDKDDATLIKKVLGSFATGQAKTPLAVFCSNGLNPKSTFRGVE